MFETLSQWFLSLGEDYGVNPFIFGAIYIGAIPFFIASIAWLVRNARAGRSTVLPTMAAGFFFVSAYLYLAIVGNNIPVWVWIFLAVLIVWGAISQVRQTRKKIAEAKAAEGTIGEG